MTPRVVLEQVGIDYAGPVYLKLGHVRKPTIIKSYICMFVAFSVKAVHLELACVRPYLHCFYCLFTMLCFSSWET